MSWNNANLKVLLAGKRRQYVINELERHGIPYAYFKMASIKDLNMSFIIYLDLYVVSSRLGRRTTTNIKNVPLQKLQSFLQMLA